MDIQTRTEADDLYAELIAHNAVAAMRHHRGRPDHCVQGDIELARYIRDLLLEMPVVSAAGAPLAPGATHTQSENPRHVGVEAVRLALESVSAALGVAVAPVPAPAVERGLAA